MKGKIMFYHYYKIKSPVVIALLDGNQVKRRNGLKIAFDFAEKYGFEIGTSNDGVYASIDISVVGVPKELRKYFKQMPRGNWCPKKNSKIARDFAEKIKALKIKLDSPFKLVKEETGFDANIVFDMATRRVGTPKVLPIGDDYFLQVPSLSDKPPIESCEDYEPMKEWEIQKAIDECEKEKAQK